MWPLGRRALGFLELNEETDRLEGNWILRPENPGKKPGFRRRERESAEEDVSAGGRDGLRLEREEMVMDCGSVAMENLRNRRVRDWVYIYKYGEKRDGKVRWERNWRWRCGVNERKIVGLNWRVAKLWASEPLSVWYNGNNLWFHFFYLLLFVLLLCLLRSRLPVAGHTDFIIWPSDYQIMSKRIILSKYSYNTLIACHIFN